MRYDGMENWGATQANRFSFFFCCATRRDNSELCIHADVMCRYRIAEGEGDGGARWRPTDYITGSIRK